MRPPSAWSATTIRPTARCSSNGATPANSDGSRGNRDGRRRDTEERGTRMDTLTVGDATCIRIEEMIDTSFTAAGFFPAFDAERLRPHMPWLPPQHFKAGPGARLPRMDSWGA